VRGRFRTTAPERACLHEHAGREIHAGVRFRAPSVAPGLLIETLVQNGDTPMTVTVLLVAHDRRRSSSSRASVSSSISFVMGAPDWQARLATSVASRARESALRLGAELGPVGAHRDRRFVPLAAVIPAHVTH
jgi:hypothetical protein